jgi:hypothetical protein
MRRIRDQSGQSTVEWIGLVLLVAVLFGAVVAATGGRIPGADLAGAIADRIVCAAKLSECEGSADARLAAQYGEEVAVLARRYAPELIYEEGSRAVPVDYRRCRSSACGDGPTSGAVFRTDAGLPVTAFVHVVERGGSRYLQYWLYYADSASMRGFPVWGERGYHADDWESVQIRIGPGARGIEARASSHRGYNGAGGPKNWTSDAGWTSKPGWTSYSGHSFVSGGSHAGHVEESRPQPSRFVHRVISRKEQRHRWTPKSRLRLIPIEPLRGDCARHDFAVSPPWCKKVYEDPEYEGTD